MTRSKAGATALPVKVKKGASAEPSGTSNPQRDKSLAALRQFRQIFRAVQQHYHWVQTRCGVSGAQLWALYEIARTPGLRVGDLARALSVHQSTASNLLDKLEKQGFIRRERGGPDQRVVYLFPTEGGTELLDRAPQPARGVLQEALHHMPAATLDSLSNGLDELLKSMKVQVDDAMRPLVD